MNRLLCLMLAIACLCTWAAGEGWHNSLYLGNGGWWHKRVPVVIGNGMARDAAGDYASLRVGAGQGEANVAGERAEGVRVCDAAGNEMLFHIAAPDGTRVAAGHIPAGSAITIPAECPAKAGVIYYIYFDNPLAWQVPDFLTPAGARNGGVELGGGNVPDEWRHDQNDAEHQTFWVTEAPHSGARCLKTVVADGADLTWIATRQYDIPIVGGAGYLMRAWVRAENVTRGYAGWYIHAGNEDDPMILNRVISGGGGTYGWKELTLQFTAPAEAVRADIGTVLWGNGTAWFDDVSLECLTPPLVTAAADPPESIEIAEEGTDAPWFTDNTVAVTWNCRAPVRMVNVRDEAAGPAFAAVEFTPLLARLRGRASIAHARVTFAGAVVAHSLMGDLLLFECTVPPRTARTYYVYFAESAAVPDQDDTTVPDAALIASPLNLVQNPSFELDGALPDGWFGGGPGEHPPEVTMGLEDGGLFGSRCAAIRYPESVPRSWTGWRQNVPVRPYATYLYAAWLKCESVADNARIHAHYRNSSGELCQTKQYASAGPDVSGTAGWTLLYGQFEMPPDIAFFQLHLTMLATGNLWHDGALLAETLPATPGPLELKSLPGGSLAWQVNAIVKVFPDTLPPRTASPARISIAKNEHEPLQAAFRSTQAIGRVDVIVEPPVRADGGAGALDDIEIGVVGFVPIDHKTNYYNIKIPAWRRKFPTSEGACDGWPGPWPDPLMPASSFSIAANATQPVWITVRAPSNARAGDYVGRVRFASDLAVLAELPFTVHVWDFALPAENHVSAIYDVRVMHDVRWALPGKTTQQVVQEFYQFMADRRLCPDRIWPDPAFHYANGVATADFTAYDAAAEFYFTTLKRTHSYTPHCFYLFGWGHPPDAKWGEAPYEGNYPYNDIDRSVLRPEFKRAYQACLRLFWDHMKLKGWDRKIVLYVSDEPFFAQSEIIDQMKAVCNMIHEVDPRIPIYSSVWHHVPAWDGYLDVWGISHYGLVLPAKIQELLDAGDRVWWTTDGQMCTDTPYAAVERLLPHYCFKYGASAYEFWGIDWLTYDPWKFGWHSYNSQSMSPGETIWVRYPNGDGFLAYPGAPAGFDRPVTSVRMEQAREGCEDYEYLDLLRRLIIKCEQLAVDAGDAPQVMQSAAGLVGIPNAGGRYSTQILPDPDAVLRTKDALGAAIERLSRAFRPPAWPIAGDANNDCRVNVLDLICVRNRLNADPAEIDNASADVNGDAKINVLDLIGVRNELGVVCP